MTAANRQIITCYEQLGSTPQEIAQELDFDVTCVKAILMQNSSIYRKACGAEPEEEDSFNFSKEELKMANQTIVHLAAGAEEDAIRLRAATYIRDDKKGRLDIVKQMNGLNINLTVFNETFQKAQAAIERAKAAKVLKDEKVAIEA